MIWCMWKLEEATQMMHQNPLCGCFSMLTEAENAVNQLQNVLKDE